MTSNGDTDEVFDEEELAEGFDEEIVGGGDPEGDDVDDVEGDDVDDVDDGDGDGDGGDDDAVGDAGEEVVVGVVVVEEEEDVVDDADVELALDEVLAETIRRTSTPEDDEEAVGDVETGVDPAETILPKQDDEFRCHSCRLLKKVSQLADKSHMLCRDCV